MDFALSVIIPVYNCECFIEKTIASVIAQPEVTEIVVVNDGSTDTTVLLLEQLQKQYSILKIFHHQNKLNKGRSATRNLGIQKATGNYLAFLDADDYFLANRFVNDIKVFQENKNCDGIYNAVGFHFYRAATNEEIQSHQLYTVNQKLNPDFLFEALLSGKYGHFQIDGLTVKRSVFNTIGLFNEALLVAEDTEIFWKMAIKCQLETGIIDCPVAIRGVHSNNVFTQANLYEKYTIKSYESLVVWCSQNKVSYAIIDELFKWIWILKHKEKNKLFQDIGYWAKLFFPHPKLLFSVLSIKYFPVIRFRQMLFPFLYKR
ncbi:glycosyltransferase family 2 protein [Flavobacterium sp. LS2R12]|uniref:glycosyltransferase family 2 protein n=1 Tax=unclassified Flavobacterium TaxID=196869 RepID=UPI003AAC8B6F